MSARGVGVREKNALASWRRTVDQCISKALGNSFRQQILWILNERVASPSEIAKELGETLNKVCHHVKVLKDAGCIELVETRSVGSTVQHFYRATSRAMLEDTDWPDVPETVKVGLRATLLQNVVHDSVEAVAAGVYDLYEGSHMSWTPMILDEQGRRELVQVLKSALLEVIAVQESTQERLTGNGKMGAAYTVSILGYPSVGGKKRVGPPTDAKGLATSTATPKKKTRKAAKKD